ncbi:MAG: PKD domain-containing protein [Phycisphaerae bacterium]|nr:PKD domain-containing protein [Phycisphaerae bacterium]
MNRRLLTAVFILACCFLFVSRSNACEQPPIAEISNPYSLTVCVGCEVEFDGSTSYDQDEEGNSVEVYYWNYSEDSNWHEDGEEPNHVFNTAGYYGVYLYVEDDEEVMSDTYDSCIVYVVEVDKIVKQGSTNDGPLFFCPDDSVSLEAKPYPAFASFPSGEPHWSIESEPNGSNASLNPPSGSATTTLSGLTEPGEYVIKAQCGDSDMGDNIVVKTPSSGYWDSWVPGFGCPCSLLIGCGDCEDEAPDSPDDCGNTLKITCNNSSGNCRYQYWYNSTEVGRCVWIGGKNVFEYKITANGEQFLKTDIFNCNDKRGVDSDGEGCDGYFCWRRVTFDCVDTSATPQVTWRKEDLEECPCRPLGRPGIGEACLGEDGDHPGHPN